MEEQHYKPCNSKYMKKYVKDNCGVNVFTRDALPPTCKLDELMINNITTFLCYIIPNNNDQIIIDDIKDGRILGKGSFGYTFGLRNLIEDVENNKYVESYPYKNIVIKILVCLPREPNIENLKKMLEDEIKIHTILTKYDTINYIQLYGYYIKEVDGYYYYDLVNHNKQRIDFGEKKINFDNSCETYLLMHRGLKDVASYIGRIFDDYTYKTFIGDAQDIYDLLNAYKVSNIILEKEGKIFIHSDIKAENIVRAKHNYQEKYNLKLIDFGLSKLSETFFINTSDGTEYIFKILFTYQISDSTGKREIYDNRLSMISPLFDIFSIILVMFELFIKHRLNAPDYNLNKINEKMLGYANIHKTENNILYQNILRLLTIFNSIYNFHQTKIKKYYEAVIASESLVGWLKGFVSKDPLQKYIDSYYLSDLSEFKLSDIDQDIQYIKTGNKLKDDMNYLTKIISFTMELQFD